MHHTFTKLFNQSLVIAQIILLMSFSDKKCQHVIILSERGNSGKALRIYRYLINYCRYVEKCAVSS